MIASKSKCLVVVTYKPTLDQLVYLDQVADFFDHFIIVDNTEAKGLVQSYNFKSKNIHSIHNKNYNGIAGGLNAGVIHLMKKIDSPNIFFIDQDSKFSKTDIERQFQIFIKNNYDVMVSIYYDKNSKSYGSFINLNRFSFSIIRPKNKSSLFNVDIAITSGTLVNGNVFEKVGLFNEGYFIDHVDTEFCLRLKKFGYKIIANPSFVINHEIGKRATFKFLFIKTKSSFYSPIRRYYQARNSVYVVRTFAYTFPVAIIWIILRNIYDISSALLCENNRISIIKAHLHGYADGVLNPNIFKKIRKVD